MTKFLIPLVLILGVILYFRLSGAFSIWNSCPNWSPDGTEIAFTSNRDGNDEIYVMNADGSNQTRLTYNDAYDGMPAWSPDGTRIAFESRRDSNGSAIYVMNADGSNQTQLTKRPWWSPR